MKVTVQTKEQTLLHNICECCKVMDSMGIGTNRYGYEFQQLFESINEGNIDSPEVSIHCGFNKFSYFKKIQKFLESYNITLQKNLFESVTSDRYFSLFKQDLKRVIDQLEQQNDFNTTPNKFISIKAFAGIPIKLHGIEIGSQLISNAEVQSELSKQFGMISSVELIAAYYNRSNAEIYFVSLNHGIVSYQSTTDEFKRIYTGEINFNDFTEHVKSITGYNNLVEIYTNKEILYNSERFKFTDNLYSDIKQQVYQNQVMEQRLISKK